MLTFVHMGSDRRFVSGPLCSKLQVGLENPESYEWSSSINEALTIVQESQGAGSTLNSAVTPVRSQPGSLGSLKGHITIYTHESVRSEWQWEGKEESHLCDLVTHFHITWISCLTVLIPGCFLALHLYIIICAYPFTNCKSRRRKKERDNDD